MPINNIQQETKLGILYSSLEVYCIVFQPNLSPADNNLKYHK